MKVTTQTITPTIAAEMLRKNTSNRPMNRNHVARLAREMTAGNWKQNGDTICRNVERLIDGQHRLQAVVMSGVTITCLVVEGLPSDVFDTKDVGKRRSPADTLAVRGEVNCKNLAAALAVVDRYMTSRMEQTVNYTNSEIESCLDKYPEVRQSVAFVNRKNRLAPPSVLAGCHYLFSRKDSLAADSFIDGVLFGKNLDDSNPVYVLRERLLHNSLAKSKLKSDYICALFIKAWNHRRANKVIRALRFREEGPSAEGFPLVS